MNCQNCGRIATDTFCSETCEDSFFAKLLETRMRGRYADVSPDVPTCPDCGGRHYSAMKGDGRVWCHGTADKGKGAGRIITADLSTPEVTE